MLGVKRIISISTWSKEQEFTIRKIFFISVIILSRKSQSKIGDIKLSEDFRTFGSAIVEVSKSESTTRCFRNTQLVWQGVCIKYIEGKGNQ